ncbi:polysaccharide biosynthesis/export family protein [Bizionia sp. KMM 8389]
MIKKNQWQHLLWAVCVLLISSCVSKKEILYFQDADTFKETDINYLENTIQPNDILSVVISAGIPETAIPYNFSDASGKIVNNNIEMMKLQGYLVSPEGYISLPILGKVFVKELTGTEVETAVYELLESGGHLVDPVVTVRLLNAKVTVLGEVNAPGTYSFTEQYLTVPQALGYSGDLTINGRRDDVLLIREIDGKRLITHIDLRTADWMNDPKYTIRPNDVLVVQPNDAKVKTAGYIGSVTTLIAVLSLALSVTILVTR